MGSGHLSRLIRIQIVVNYPTYNYPYMNLQAWVQHGASSNFREGSGFRSILYWSLK